jgi:hypothetical protein
METKNVDLNYLYTITGNNKDEMFEYVIDVLDMTENTMSAIDIAFEKEDFKIIRESAQKIKSTLKVFGNHSLLPILSNLESDDTNKSTVSTYYHTLKQELPLWERALMMEINKL